MELKKAFQYAMALLPAIFCFFVWVLPLLSKVVAKTYNDYEAVKLAKEMVVHGSLIGPTVTVLIGYGKEPCAWAIAAAWFFILIRLSYVLSLRCRLLKIGETHA